MEVRPYRPCTASDVGAAQARVEEILATWSAAWTDAGGVGGEVSASIGENPAAFASDGPWCTVAGSHASVWTRTASAAVATELLFDEAVVGGRRSEGLAMSLGRRALAELLSALAGTAPTGASGLQEVPAPVHLLQAGRAVLRLQLELATAGVIDVYLERSGPVSEATPGRGPALADLSLGLADQAVEVQAVLGDTEIELGLLHGLAIGDVLRLDAQVDDGIELRIGGKRLPCKGYLGTIDGRLAVELGRP